MRSPSLSHVSVRSAPRLQHGTDSYELVKGAFTPLDSQKAQYIRAAEVCSKALVMNVMHNTLYKPPAPETVSMQQTAYPDASVDGLVAENARLI